MLTAVETDIVHHRAARWEIGRKRKPGKAACQASQAPQPEQRRTDGQPARQSERASEPML